MNHICQPFYNGRCWCQPRTVLEAALDNRWTLRFIRDVFGDIGLRRRLRRCTQPGAVIVLAEYRERRAS